MSIRGEGIRKLLPVFYGELFLESTVGRILSGFLDTSVCSKAYERKVFPFAGTDLVLGNGDLLSHHVQLLVSAEGRVDERSEIGIGKEFLPINLPGTHS